MQLVCAVLSGTGWNSIFPYVIISIGNGLGINIISAFLCKSSTAHSVSFMSSLSWSTSRADRLLKPFPRNWAHSTSNRLPVNKSPVLTGWMISVSRKVLVISEFDQTGWILFLCSDRSDQLIISPLNKPFTEIRCAGTKQVTTAGSEPHGFWSGLFCWWAIVAISCVKPLVVYGGFCAGPSVVLTWSWR